MHESNPIRQSWLNKGVRQKYSQDKWIENLPFKLLEGLRAKFHQHHNLKTILNNTQNLRIVQACPWDEIYSCGLGISDPNIWNSKNWKKNLLGHSLMTIREENNGTTKGAGPGRIYPRISIQTS
jgi:ribA/ribD-fused uncharacterized protein